MRKIALNLSSLRRFLLHHVPFIILFCLVFSYAAFTSLAHASDQTAPKKTSHTGIVKIIRTSDTQGAEENVITIASFTVETVSDPESVRKGLSGRDNLPKDHGMLFILDDRRPHAFWMKGMLFPLDILFFDRNRKLINIFRHLLPCKRCISVSPSRPAAYVLEINAGLSRELGIQVGDLIVTGE